ncbi:MAG: M48 family metalloprotease [Myxococcota bacterium]
MPSLRRILDDAADALVGRAFDPHLVGESFVDLGPQAARARAVAARLNAVRDGAPKEPVLLWSTSYLAVTKRGPWVYLSRRFAATLSDDALAFVIGHEVAHHDLGHLSAMYLAAAALGNGQAIEFAADRHGLALALKAGYARDRALEALDPRWDDDEPADPFAHLPPALGAYLNRFRRSHPSIADRRRALLG